MIPILSTNGLGSPGTMDLVWFLLRVYVQVWRIHFLYASLLITWQWILHSSIPHPSFGDTGERVKDYIGWFVKSMLHPYSCLKLHACFSGNELDHSIHHVTLLVRETDITVIEDGEKVFTHPTKLSETYLKFDLQHLDYFSNIDLQIANISAVPINEMRNNETDVECWVSLLSSFMWIIFNAFFFLSVCLHFFLRFRFLWFLLLSLV